MSLEPSLVYSPGPPLCHSRPQIHTYTFSEKKLNLECSNVRWFYCIPSWSLFLWEMLSSNKSASIPVSIIWWYLDSFYSLVQGEKCCSDLTNHIIPLFWPQRLVQGGEYDPVRPKKVVTRLLMGAPTREAFSFFFRYKLNVELLGYSLKQLDVILLLQCLELLKMRPIHSKTEWKEGEKPILLILLELLDPFELQILRHFSYKNQKTTLLFKPIGSIILTLAIARFLTVSAVYRLSNV